jgi:Ca-activated chloride channel family protein
MERLPSMVRARLRKRWRWTSTAVALLVSACRLAPAQEEPAFRVDVRLVNVVATVKNLQDAPVGDLEKEDFTLLAAGVPQRISIFERQTDRPLSVALLFDASASVAKELKFAREAAMRFIRNLLGGGANPGDRIAIYRFSHDVEEILGFAASLERLEKAVQSIQISGGTSVYDAFYLAARRLEGRQGRKVIVIITDGGDTTSSTTFHQALEAAQLADAVIYSIIVVPITSDAGRNLGGENALRTMSASTGGLAFMQYSDQDMDLTFREIERDLRIQYLIGFYPQGLPATKERFRKIELRVNRPGLRVLARSGFYLER